MPDKELSVKTLLSILNSLAPFTTAESWDNVGLMVGSPDQPVSGVIVALDPTETLLDQAVSQGINTIITHHPLIFQAVKTIHTGSPLGRMLKTALAHELAIIACHTNLDLAADGVSNAMAEKLGLLDTRPLTGENFTPQSSGFGKIGHLAEPMPARQFINLLLAALDLEAAQFAGRLPATISKVALCGGSGSELAEKARDLGADLYISGEIKHSVALWAENSDFCVIDAGHFPTEQSIVPAFAEKLRKACDAEGFTLAVTTSQRQKNPLRWITPF